MKYPGGKGKCYQHLINLMPQHATYIESHLGGGAVLRHKRPAARNVGVEIDQQVIGRWEAAGLPSVELVNDDAVRYLSTFPFKGNELVYCDPPYLHSTRRGGRIYKYEYEVEDHERLLRVLVDLPCMVMVSGYASSLYDDRLRGWRKHTFMAKSHTDVREETVWMNFSEPTVLHDARYLGSTFRERQAIQRKKQSLCRRVTALDRHERSDFIRWMSTTFQDEFQEALCK